MILFTFYSETYKNSSVYVMIIGFLSRSFQDFSAILSGVQTLHVKKEIAESGCQTVIAAFDFCE